MSPTRSPGSIGHYTGYLPPIPDIAAQVLFMIEGGRTSTFADLEELIGGDPGLTSRILKIANSSLYSRPRGVTRLSAAIALLGINAIQDLVLMVIGTHVLAQGPGKPFFLDYWKHSLITAFYAKELALVTGNPDLAEEAFSGGLLHNIGQTALFFSDPEEYPGLLVRARSEGVRLRTLELDQYGADHLVVGAEVMVNWNLPDLYVDLAREHGNENIVSSHKKTILAVSAAGFLASNHLAGGGPEIPLERLHPVFLALGGDPVALEAWARGYRTRLATLPLYRSCKSLFSP